MEGQPVNDNTPGADSTPDAYARARRWQILWPQVIALAWTNPDFKRALQEDPKSTIERSFGYELSDGLDLTICDVPEEYKEKSRFKPEVFQAAIDDPMLKSPFKDAWAGLPPMKLTLFIPPIPEAEDQAIAVTAYSDTGRTYPITSG